MEKTFYLQKGPSSREFRDSMDSRELLEPGKKAFSPKRGLVFAVNGARRPRRSLPPPQKNSPRTPLAATAPPPSPLLEEPPPPPGIFSKTPTARKGGGGRVAGGGGGAAEAPFTAKTSPFFGENALKQVKIRPFSRDSRKTHSETTLW